MRGEHAVEAVVDRLRQRVPDTIAKQPGRDLAGPHRKVRLPHALAVQPPEPLAGEVGRQRLAVGVPSWGDPRKRWRPEVRLRSPAALLCGTCGRWFPLVCNVPNRARTLEPGQSSFRRPPARADSIRRVREFLNLA